MPLKKQAARGGAGLGGKRQANAVGGGAVSGSPGAAGAAGSSGAAGSTAGSAAAGGAGAGAGAAGGGAGSPATRPAPAPRALDPVWGVDLRQPLPPKPVVGVAALLAPVLDEPLPVVIDQPPLPPVAELLVLHRAEAEAEFEEPPVTGAGDEPAVPGRFAAGLAVLPHIEFPA